MKTSSTRYKRWVATRWAASALPPLRRAMPFYLEAARPAPATERERFSHREDWNPMPREADLGARREQGPIPDVLTREEVLYALGDTTVLGNTGVLVDEAAERLLVVPSLPLEVTYHHFRPVYLRPRRMAPGRYFSMLGSYRGHEHLYHFLFDRLPHLWFLTERFETGSEPITVLTNEKVPGFQQDAFRFAAERAPQLRFKAIPGNERWRLPALFQIDRNQAIELTYADPGALAYVGDLYLDGYGIGRKAQGTRKLYISRGDTKKRRVTNEAELLPLLKAQGFEIVEAARMSFREQVATFSEASHVIGTHGAGLSHMVFSPPGAAALEIFPANKIIVSYYLLCRSLGRRYRSLIAGPGEHREHYSVDPAAFEAALDEFLNGPEGPA